MRTERPAIDAAKARSLALGWLVRREHSRDEIEAKLKHKGCDPGLAAEVAGRLVAERLQSDERFCEVLVRSRRERGHGPVRITKELEEKGVAPEEIARWVDVRDPDWAMQAARVRARRFGASIPQDYAERSKQARFLQYRGFTFDQIQRAFDARAQD